MFRCTAEWIKMKLGLWQRIDKASSGADIPDWVSKAIQEHYQEYQEKHGTRPYDIQKRFYGRSFVYRVDYIAVAQGQIREEVFRKLKRPFHKRCSGKLTFWR